MVSDWEGEYLEPGTIIDEKFEVRRVLGTGAMGAVLEATHLLRRAPVALKFMSPRMVHLPGVVERFLNEGVAASRINNEHVVKVLDVSKLPNGQPYLVMEFLDGEDLASLLEREGKHGLEDVPRAVHFVLQVLRGLQVAHHVGIIHRDLKPANCFVVTYDGEPDFIKIVDFGISKVQEAGSELNLTQEGSTMGTPLYVSLEQARDAAHVDARSDLYSVAVILYELLSGHTPFSPRSLPDLFVQLATVTPKSLDEIRDLPPGLAAAVQRGLEKLPEDRFQSTVEMAAALAPYADERSELVLRQLLQRPSLRTSRTPSLVPARSVLPPSSRVELSEPTPLPSAALATAQTETPGTLLAVSKSDAVPGRSVVAEAPGKRGPLPKAAAAAVGAALVAVAVVAVVTRQRSPAEPRASGTDSGLAVPGAHNEPPSPAAGARPTLSPVERAPVKLQPLDPAPPPSASIAPAASARAAARPPGSAPPAASAPPEPKSPANKPNRPSLNNIGIQD